jgi:Domain of Unknown Function (DUF1080)
MSMRIGICWALAFCWFVEPIAAHPADDDFVPMFNGKDLTGWVNVNCAPSTFYVKDNEIITTGRPTGYLRTAKQYENFIAEFDWMHVPSAPGAVGNSGFFVWADPIPAVGTGYTRGIEVQVLVNLTYKNKKGEITATSQGDLFSIWGATCVPDRPHPDGWARCLPSENHCKGANEWNHYRVEANDGVIKLAVNGHVVSGLSKCKPRKGYLALESEGSECHFRNLKIKELPTTNPKPDEIADEDTGFRSLYTGLDLSGWDLDESVSRHWQPRDFVLHYDDLDLELRSRRDFGSVEFLVDCRFPARGAKPCTFTLYDPDGDHVITVAPDGKVNAIVRSFRHPIGLTASAEQALKPLGQWNRVKLTFPESVFSVTINGASVQPLSAANSRRKRRFGLWPRCEMEFANLFMRELK